MPRGSRRRSTRVGTAATRAAHARLSPAGRVVVDGRRLLAVPGTTTLAIVKTVVSDVSDGFADYGVPPTRPAPYREAVTRWEHPPRRLDRSHDPVSASC